ncbi:MAG: hypothetical protein OXD54_06795 [Candidatus Poribacteria bacterium]|nr:hypothetical protein [Candidatus Poribacteria bacterium]
MSDSQKVEIILTFDDGPDNASGSANKTQRVFNTLANNSIASGIKSVFFIQSYARNNEGIIIGACLQMDALQRQQL